MRPRLACVAAVLIGFLGILIAYARAYKRWDGDLPASQRVVVVGNGASVRGTGLGPVVDGYDCVIRFNCFDQECCVDDVGARCDVLVCNFGRMACGLAKRFDAPPRVVGIPQGPWRPWGRLQGLGSYLWVHALAALHPRAFVGPAQGACGAGDCSIGLRLLDTLVARGHVVHIHGFDHSHHHYGRYQGRGGAHDWAHQRAVMDRWLAEGRLRRVA